MRAPQLDQVADAEPPTTATDAPNQAPSTWNRTRDAVLVAVIRTAPVTAAEAGAMIFGVPVGRMCSNAARKSTRPVPRPCPANPWADAVTAVRRSATEIPGCCAAINAASPATSGEEKEVPSPTSYDADSKNADPAVGVVE